MAEDEYNDDWETSVDPGPWMLVGTVIFCVLSLAVLPCLVSLGRRYEKRRLKMTQEDDVHEAAETPKEDGVEERRPGRSLAASETPSSFVHGTSKSPGTSNKSLLSGNLLRGLVDKVVMPPYPDDAGSNLFMPYQKTRSEAAESFFSAEGSVISSVATSTTLSWLDTGGGFRNRNAVRRHYHRGVKDRKHQTEQKAERKADEGNDAYVPLQREQGWKQNESLRRLDDDNASVASKSVMSELEDTALSPNDAVDAQVAVTLNERADMEGDDEFDLCCGDHAWWRPSMIASGFDRLLTIAEWDRETKRIVGLAVPFSLGAVSKGIFQTIRVGLVAHYLGTEAVAAYTIVDIILGLTQEFFGGFALTVAALGSQAVGSKNHKLAGEYVQISVILFAVCFIPNILFWMFLTDDIVKLFGFNDNTARMAQNYAYFFVFQQLVDGFFEAITSLLEVIDHERFTVFMQIATEFVCTMIVLALLLAESITLADVGLIQLTITVCFFGLTIALALWFGWMKKYTEGMFRTCALQNKTAVAAVFKMAVPLAFGQLLQFGEWEVLTIFVAHIGPNEVIAWGILGSLWDTLETLTEGFGDAGEIRVAFHMGAGKPATAKYSSYKTILVGVIMATLLTSVMWMLGLDLAKWLTPDPALQYLIAELLPLVGIGNVALTAGTVSWALVGAQGRYRLATLTAFVASWCVTLPLAAIFTYGLNFDLQGVTASVVAGYSVTGTALLYILIRSDWERLSKIVVELNALDDDSSSSSSSGSSSDDED